MWPNPKESDRRKAVANESHRTKVVAKSQQKPNTYNIYKTKTQFITTKHNLRILGVSPLFKLQNNTKQQVNGEQ